MDYVVLPVGRILDVRVHLQMQRKTLDPLLQGEVCGKALDGDGDEGWLLERVPIHSDGVVGHIL